MSECWDRKAKASVLIHQGAVTYTQVGGKKGYFFSSLNDAALYLHASTMTLSGWAFADSRQQTAGFCLWSLLLNHHATC